MPEIIRKPELLKLLGISNATLSRMENAGDFPKRIYIGSGKIRGKAAWRLAEVDAWIDEQFDKREKGDNDEQTH